MSGSPRETPARRLRFRECLGRGKISGMPEPPHSQAPFRSTCWTVVRAAGEESKEALEVLCERYWPPLYGWLRRKGHSPEDAQDLLQGFLGDLLERGDIATANPVKGRFRGWLLVCLENWAAKEARREGAQKRGGGRAVLSIDFEGAEDEHARLEVADGGLGPDEVFDRRWALGIVESSLERLRGEHAKRGKGEVFQAIAGRLTGGGADAELAAVGERFGMGEEAVKALVFRARRRFRGLVTDAVRETLDEGEDVEEELGVLLGALRGGGAR